MQPGGAVYHRLGKILLTAANLYNPVIDQLIPSKVERELTS
jgi:hypothetical protein